MPSESPLEPDNSLHHCHLQKHSVSVRWAIRLQRQLSNSFLPVMDRRTRSVVDNPAITPNYTCASVDYVPRRQIEDHCRQLLFSFPVTDESTDKTGDGFMVFNEYIPGIFLDLCFGAIQINTDSSRVDLNQEETQPKAALFLMQKLAQELVQGWYQLWKPFLRFDACSQWLGQSSHPMELQQDYLVSRFMVGFACADEKALLSQPFAEFCMPVNTLCNLLNPPPSESGTQNYKARIIDKLLNTPVTVTAELTCNSFHLSRLKGLKPGDILPINKPDTVYLKTANTVLFCACAGQLSEQLVCQIVDATEIPIHVPGCERFHE